MVLQTIAAMVQHRPRFISPAFAAKSEIVAQVSRVRIYSTSPRQ
jgi:hypothetical protein